MKAIILARVSSKDQEDGLSIPSQVRRLNEYAARKNLEIAHTFQITESSTKDTRKQFDKVITLIKESKHQLVLVTDTIDRLQRSFRETPLLDELRKQGKLELQFVRENLVLNKDSNSADLTRWDFGVIGASLYVRQLSDNVKRSKEQAIKEGVWVSKAPYGYKNITLPTGKKAIEVDEQKSFFVVEMFKLYSTKQYSFQTITNKINELGAKNRDGNPLLPSAVEGILKNTFYYGKMLIKDELYTHKYPPLISEQLFKKVQDAIREHNKSPVQYAGKELLFRGMVKCAYCGCTVTGYTKKNKYVYYCCSNAKGICIRRLIKEEVIEQELLDVFDKLKLSDEKIAELISFLRTADEKEQVFTTRSQEALRNELMLLKGRMSKLTDIYVDGGIDQESYKTKLAEYKKREYEITQELSALDNDTEDYIVTMELVLELTRKAKDIYMSSTVDEKRQFLNFVQSNLKLDSGKVLWELREPFSTLVKINDQPLWLGREESNLYNWNQNPESCH